MYRAILRGPPAPRISLGALLDRTLGGGVKQTTTVLLGGGPGCGKSTIVLRAAERFCALGECLYFAAEEDLADIAERGERLGIDDHDRLSFKEAIGGNVDVLGVMYERRPAGVIIDSIDGLVGRDPEAEMALLDIIKKACVSLRCPALIISQVNKAEDYSGFQAKKHHVDVLMTLEQDTEIRSENGEPIRILSTEKSRIGPAHVETWLAMGENGLDLWTSEEAGVRDGVEVGDEPAPEPAPEPVPKRRKRAARETVG